MKKYLLINTLTIFFISCSQPQQKDETQTSKPQFEMDSIHLNVEGLLGAYNTMVQHDKESFLGLDRIHGVVDSVNINGGGRKYDLDNLTEKYSFFHSEMRKNDGLVFLMSPLGDLAILKSNKIIKFFKLYDFLPEGQKLQVFNYGFSFLGTTDYVFFTTLNSENHQISLAKFNIESEEISFFPLPYQADADIFRDNFLNLNDLHEGKLNISFRNTEDILLFDVVEEDFQQIQTDFNQADEDLFKYFEADYDETDKMRTSGYYSQIISVPEQNTHYRFFVFPQELWNNQQKANSTIYRKFMVLKYNDDFSECKKIELPDSIYNQISVFKYLVFNDSLYFIPKSKNEDMITLVKFKEAL
ncbi:hypothetical protein [Marivirga sp.]|uniref:hypothetical protein n=1 Tax=Marivirga sp. TaxID=2018662 RepID=UPI003DA748A3